MISKAKKCLQFYTKHKNLVVLTGFKWCDDLLSQIFIMMLLLKTIKNLYLIEQWVDLDAPVWTWLLEFWSWKCEVYIQ